MDYSSHRLILALLIANLVCRSPFQSGLVQFSSLVLTSIPPSDFSKSENKSLVLTTEAIDGFDKQKYQIENFHKILI